MYKEITKNIPQIIAIVSISRDGTITLKKDVLRYLGATNDERLYIDTRTEIILTTSGGEGREVLIPEGKRLRLPEKMVNKLDIIDGTNPSG